jgi:hypothetical protein
MGSSPARRTDSPARLPAAMNSPAPEPAAETPSPPRTSHVTRIPVLLSTIDPEAARAAKPAAVSGPSHRHAIPAVRIDTCKAVDA